MRLRRLSFNRDAPIVFRELSLLAMWLWATPRIDNYITIERVFEPVWYFLISAGHLVRWFILIRQIKTPVYLKWVYNAPVLPLAVLWAFILWGEVRIVDAYYPFVLILFGLLVGCLHWARRLHGWVSNAAMLLLIALTVYYQLFTLTGIYICLYVLFALGGLLFRKDIYRAPPWVASMAFANLLAAFLLFHFRFVNGENLDLVSKHPGVERLFVYDDSDPVGRMIGKNIMVIEESCEPNKYLIGSHHGGAGFVLVDRTKNAAYTNPHIEECSNDILLDCTTYEAVAGSFSKPGGIYTFDLKNWPNLSKPAVPIPGSVVYIVFDKLKDIFLVFPEHPVLLAVDAKTGKINGALNGPDERAYHPRTGELTTLTEPDFSIMRLKIVDDENTPFQVIKKRSLGVPVYKRIQMYFLPGPIDGTTLVTNLWEGTVTLYDRDLEPLRQTRIAPGISGMILTADKRHLLIGGYGDGKLYFMDMNTWEVIAGLYLGHRMRELRLSRDGRFVYVGTSQGGFRVDIQRVLVQPSGNPN